MAMHKKLTEGTIITTFCTAEPILNNSYYHRKPNYNPVQNNYEIYFKMIVVSNRRERTTGSYLSIDKQATLIPFLEKWKVRINHHYGNSKIAVGLRTKSYYKVRATSPYPMKEHLEAAEQALQEYLEGNSEEYFINEDFERFSEKKSSNKDFLFKLDKPFEDNYIDKFESLF